MTLCAISLGGNVGDVPATMAAAVQLLTSSGDISDLRMSRLYRTAPVGAVAGDVFHNAAAVFETTLSPLDLLELLQQIEDRCGRIRTVHWGSRTLDLDLLLYGDEILGDDILQSPPMASAGTLLRSVANESHLIVPHPALWYRRFVLDPLVELIPDVVHPVFHQTIRQLRDRLLPRPLPVCFLVAQTFLSVRTDRNVCATDPSTAAIIFSESYREPSWPHVIHLPDDETAAAVQMVTDVLTAALDGPVAMS